MDKFQESLNQSIRHLQIADHMAYVSYPLINEKRILLKIIEEIHASITNSIDSILEFESRQSSDFKKSELTTSSDFKKSELTTSSDFKKSELTTSSDFKKSEPTTNNKKPSPESFFKRDFQDYNLTENHIKKIQEILEIADRHKESAMEFVRNEKIVILSNKLGIKILDIQLVKSYLLAAKELLLKVNQRIDKSLNNY